MKGVKKMVSEAKLKSKSGKRNVLLIPFILILIVTLCYVGYSFITLQIEINNKNAQLQQITEQTEQIKAQNQLLIRYSEDDYKVEYIENIAREDLDYALPEERIYYIVPID